MDAEQFWMVLGAGEPVFQHSDLASARREAERLATEHVLSWQKPPPQSQPFESDGFPHWLEVFVVAVGASIIVRLIWEGLCGGLAR